MTLNKKECKNIMQTIVKFGLAKAGISSTLHTAVRYGPRSLGDIEIFDPFFDTRNRQNSLCHKTLLEFKYIYPNPSGQPIHYTTVSGERRAHIIK